MQLNGSENFIHNKLLDGLILLLSLRIILQKYLGPDLYVQVIIQYVVVRLLSRLILRLVKVAAVKNVVNFDRFLAQIVEFILLWHLTRLLNGFFSH